MRFRDLIGSALSGLWRQKARTLLTLLGVTVGTTALAYCLALGVGLRVFIENEFKLRREFWTVNVHAKNFGQCDLNEAEIPPEKIAVPAEVPAERAERLRARLILDFKNRNRAKKLSLVTNEQIAKFRELPDVEDLLVARFGSAQLTVQDQQFVGLAYAGRLDHFEPALETHLLFGRVAAPTAADEVVVSEMALFKLGLKTDAELQAIVGQRIRLVMGRSDAQSAAMLANALAPGAVQEQMNRIQSEVLNKIARQLPNQIDKFELTDVEKELAKAVMSKPKTKSDVQQKWSDQWYTSSGEFTIVGVSRLPEIKKLDPTDLLAGMPLPGADVLLSPAGEQKLFSQVPELANGYTDVTIRVRPGGDLQAVVKAVEESGLETFNGLRFYKSVKREVTLISAGLNLFALISLFVAAIGITNTLFTSVLERTKEIGIWKSLGARDGSILLLFLLEGSALGLFGGCLGILLAWGLSIPSDGWVRQLIEQQRGGEPLLSVSVFNWPVWLPFAVGGFSTLLTTLAAIYPASRAARVQPVEALRHE
jgi:putative ABC transport system permease protein